MPDTSLPNASAPAAAHDGRTPPHHSKPRRLRRIIANTVCYGGILLVSFLLYQMARVFWHQKLYDVETDTVAINHDRFSMHVTHMSEKEGIRRIAQIARTSYKEDSWICARGTWHEIGNNERFIFSGTMAASSVSTPRLTAQGVLNRYPKDTLFTFYHNHPSDEQFRKGIKTEQQLSEEEFQSMMGDERNDFPQTVRTLRKAFQAMPDACPSVADLLAMIDVAASFDNYRIRFRIVSRYGVTAYDPTHLAKRDYDFESEIFPAQGSRTTASLGRVRVQSKYAIVDFRPFGP